MDRSTLIGTLLLVAAAIGLAQITTAAKFAYEAGAEPMTLVWLRIVAMLCVIGPMQWLRGAEIGLPLPVLKKTIPMAAFLMLMSVGYLSAVAYIPVSLAVVLLYTFPLMVGVLAPALGRERMTPLKALFLIGTFVGLVIACGPTLDGDFDWRGVAWALAAAAGVALSVTFGASAIGKVDPLTVNLWSNLWMFVAATAFILIGPGFHFPGTLSGWIGALCVAGFYVLGFGCIFSAMPKLPPAQIAVILNFEPVVSTFSAVFILNEAVSTQTWIGIVIMLGFMAPATIIGARPERAKIPAEP